MERHVCQFQTVSTEGFTPRDCAQFCAHHQTLPSATGGQPFSDMRLQSLHL
jgi:hypothetical protein